jgi:hypothetical protein
MNIHLLLIIGVFITIKVFETKYARLFFGSFLFSVRKKSLFYFLVKTKAAGVHRAPVLIFAPLWKKPNFLQ